jgi:hypothetical protein
MLKKYLVCLFLVGVFIPFFLSCASVTGSSSDGSSDSEDESEASISVFSGFTHTPLAISDIDNIVPPGSIAGGVIKAHSFVRVKESVPSATVYAAVDSILVGIGYYNQSGTQLYTLLFKVNDDVYYYYDHLKIVVPAILAVAPEVPSDSSQTVYLSEGVPFNGGDDVGVLTGPLSDFMDFGTYDLSYVAPLAAPNRYSEKTQNGKCPYDLFSAEIKAQFLALFQTSGGIHVDVDACRDVSRDVDGSHAGAWFRETPTDNVNYAAQMNLADDYGKQVRIGGIGNKEMWVTFATDPSNSSYQDPATQTGSHCYKEDASRGDGYVFVQLVSDTEVDVAFAEGDCPDTFPSLNALRYER